MTAEFLVSGDSLAWLAFCHRPVINSELMKIRTLYKIVALLLLATLLAANAAAAVDDIWCVGNDGHLTVKSASDEACCAERFDAGQNRQKDLPTLRATGNACGPCLDIFRKKVDVTLLKRSAKVSFPCPGMITVPTQSRGFQQDLAPGTPPHDFPKRVSQTLLAHRTVVLLN